MIIIFVGDLYSFILFNTIQGNNWTNFQVVRKNGWKKGVVLIERAWALFVHFMRASQWKREKKFKNLTHVCVSEAHRSAVCVFSIAADVNAVCVRSSWSQRDSVCASSGRIFSAHACAAVCARGTTPLSGRLSVHLTQRPSCGQRPSGGLVISAPPGASGRKLMSEHLLYFICSWPFVWPWNSFVRCPSFVRGIFM